MPVDLYIDVHAMAGQDFDGIQELSRSAIVAVSDNGNGVFSLYLQNMNAVPEPTRTVWSRAVSVRHVRVLQNTEGAKLSSRNLEQIDLVHERNYSYPMVECLNTDLAAVGQ